MTVRELKDLLSSFDDDMEVCFKPSNSYYAESISDYGQESEIHAFYGKDFNAVVIGSSGQVGSV